MVYRILKEFGKGVAVVGLMGATTLGLLTVNDNLKPKKRFNAVKNVQPGFIAPSQLEIYCEDLDKTDGKGLPETYIKVGNQRYLLREVNGSPVISAYDFKPAEVVPRE